MSVHLQRVEGRVQSSADIVIMPACGHASLHQQLPGHGPCEYQRQRHAAGEYTAAGGYAAVFYVRRVVAVGGTGQ